MPRPGFYNDNEYRAYPFVYDKPATLPPLPTSVIVDAGFVMGLDAYFDETQHTVWLSAINSVVVDTVPVFEFVFKTNASSATLSFFREQESNEWLNEYAESAPLNSKQCAEEPIWSGFIATGPLGALRDVFSSGTWSFTDNDYRVEPALIQNLNKAYLRSISVGNYDRVRVPACGVTGTNDNRPIILNARCIKGDIRLKEGYNCLITQTDRANELSVSATKGAGAGSTSAELCAHGSEIPLYPAEPLAADSKFFSGGPACDELITTVNGVGGTNINIIGGAGINILIDDGTIKVQKKPNAQVNCT
jgi:hypothetical protein